jgi:hypothetical protein
MLAHRWAGGSACPTFRKLLIRYVGQTLSSARRVSGRFFSAEKGSGFQVRPATAY